MQADIFNTLDTLINIFVMPCDILDQKTRYLT